MPNLIEDAFASIGQTMDDWLTLEPLAPAYRANFADGSVLDVHHDPQHMAAEIARHKAGLKTIHVHIVRPGSKEVDRLPEGFHSAIDDEAREWRIYNILIPILTFFPTVRGYSILPDAATAYAMRQYLSNLYPRELVPAAGEPRAITGPEAQADVHRWRRLFPAIAVSADTALADNPRLTARGAQTPRSGHRLSRCGWPRPWPGAKAMRLPPSTGCRAGAWPACPIPRPCWLC